MSKFVSTLVNVLFKITIYVVIILLIVRFGISAYRFGYNIFGGKALATPPGMNIELTIDEEMSKRELANYLEANNVIADALTFEIQSYFFDYEIKSGTYIFNNSYTPRKIIDILIEGPDDDSK